MPQGQLSTGVEGQLRTEVDSKEKVKQMQGMANITQREQISKQCCFHPVDCAFWDFNFATLTGNPDINVPEALLQLLLSPYSAFTYEGMHNDDLGVFLSMVDVLKKLIHARGVASDPSWTDAKTNAKLRTLNIRMRMCPPAVDFNLPYCGGKYFPDKSKVQAREHKHVMQIIVFLAYGVLDDEVVEVFIL